MSIVASFAVSHAPGILSAPDRPPAEVADRVQSAYAEAQRRLHAARPEAVVLVTSEHFANFFEIVPAFYLNVAGSAHGPVEGWLGIEERDVPGHPALARRVLEHALDAGFDLAFGDGLALDHGCFVPIEKLGLAEVPVVPLLVNALVEPMPTLRRCRDLGIELGSALQAAPERVALVAAGGLSHWPGMAEAGLMSPEWDEAVLRQLEAGDREVLWEPPSDGLEEAGPGAAELRSWAVVGAAAPAAPADILGYEPVAEWATGCAVVALGGEGA